MKMQRGSMMIYIYTETILSPTCEFFPCVYKVIFKN